MQMQMRYLLALGASLALLAVFASPAQANELTAFIVTPTCTGYSISITVSDLSSFRRASQGRLPGDVPEFRTANGQRHYPRQHL